MLETPENKRAWVRYIFPANLIFYLETCCDTFHVHFWQVSCHAFELFIDNVHWLHLIDSTATASTNISNYFCALWPKRRIELFTNLVEIPQSSPRRFFISYFRLLLLLLFGRLQPTLVGSCPIYSSGLRNFFAGILVSQITDYRFLFANN